MSGQESDHLVDARLTALRQNVSAALADKVISEVAACAGLHPTEVTDLIAGATTVDLYVLARLEETLGVPLWPRAGPDSPDGGR